MTQDLIRQQCCTMKLLLYKEFYQEFYFRCIEGVKGCVSSSKSSSDESSEYKESSSGFIDELYCLYPQ